ncbi:WecB/TagA/CpsF family glycosyltransferase [Yeosuana sp. MJ-SS3]|uniref:WecB/TagA/CpsF family glycosyltransferase n=1 Tax=Gilvirhabdus luticola TaxID=3079858 RepID=A0ABU3U2M9_9FLAO|nr:WecB/TagA/CpsF family glycosyltransferase [Yeosuana sp. MJ-SS3]MDU8884643.1 WecB/TagA/CpsF family glycosyltransferase [Yeosuana sp. MJ-SS3]
MCIKLNEYKLFNSNLESILEKNKKIVINTINAHSYIVAKKDAEFKNALVKSEVLLPDGEGIVFMVKQLQGIKIRKIAGADLHLFLLDYANKKKLKCFYLGSNQKTLNLIKERLSDSYPNLKFSFFSPPFKYEFSVEDNNKMISEINSFNPDILFVGMTAPKQEKWVTKNKEFIDAKIICSIGAVFDFFAGTKKRAPAWLIALKLEWFYRSFTAWRLAKRYLYSTPLFLIELYRLKLFPKQNKADV